MLAEKCLHEGKRPGECQSMNGEGGEGVGAVIGKWLIGRGKSMAVDGAWAATMVEWNKWGRELGFREG